MGKGIFVTGTGTDIGKTYVTALIVKKLADAGIRTGYYKAALSGAKSIGDSDAGYVKKIAGISTGRYQSAIIFVSKCGISSFSCSNRR